MPQMLFTNANLVLDGLAELQRGFNVLVSDGRIAAVSAGRSRPATRRSSTSAAAR